MRCTRFAIAMLAAVASLAAESHRAAAADPSRDRETVISRVSVGPEGSGRFEGGSAPHARIALVLDGRTIGETTANPEGAWQMSVAQSFPAGDHRVRAVARTDEGEPSVSATVRISIPVAFAEPAAETAEGDLIRRAGELADRASKAFDELLPRLTDPAGTIGPMPSPDEAGLLPQPPPGVKLAAFQVTQPVPVHSDAATGEGVLQWLASILAGAEAWLEASARDYQSVVVRRLAEPPPTALGAPKVQRPPASQPLDLTTRAAEAERLREAEAKRAADEARRREQLAKAEADARRLAEAEAKRKADEARRQQERARVDAETVRKAAEARRLEEAEARRKVADEVRRQQELARAEAEISRKAAEAQRLAEAEAKRREAEEVRRQQEVARSDIETQRMAAAENRSQPQPAEPPAASLEPGARAMAVATPAPLGVSKRATPRKAARRDKPQLARYTGATAGSGNWCDFFQYSYPMELLDPGHWVSASTGRR
jgi:hypothetical protein